MSDMMIIDDDHHHPSNSEKNKLLNCMSGSLFIYNECSNVTNTTFSSHCLSTGTKYEIFFGFIRIHLMILNKLDERLK